MEKAAVRPLDSPELQEGVDKLRALVYPYNPNASDVEWHRSIWRWLARHPLGSEMHRWALVADDRVVGHLAAMPQYYWINGQRVVAHTPADYQALPEYGFHALTLMRKFFRTCENYVACDEVPGVIRIETRMGGEVVGQLQYAAKLLNVARLPVPPVPAPVRRGLHLPRWIAPARGYPGPSGGGPADIRAPLAPPPVRPRAPIPAPVSGLLNGGLRAVDEALGSAFGGDVEVQVLEGFDEAFDRLFEAVAAGVPCVPEKDAAFLRWRYGPGSPAAPVTVLGVRGGEALLGYAVLRVATSGLDRGVDAGILDLTTLPGRHDVARALLRETARYFRRVGAHIIRYRFLESPTAPRLADLRRLGFFPRRGRRLTLLAKFADPGLHRVAVDPANWSYAVGDGESTFWVR